MFIREQMTGQAGFIGLLSQDYYEVCCDIFDDNYIASSAYWKLTFFGA